MENKLTAGQLKLYDHIGQGKVTKKEVEVTIAMYEDDLPFHAGMSLRIEPLPRGSHGFLIKKRLDF